MENNIIKLDASEYGIEPSKAKQLEKVFVPMVEKFKELEKEYNLVLSSKEITKDVCDDAKTVRNKYVKVRTGADAVHKIAKEKILIETRAIDGLRNIIKYAVIDHEESLMKVERHFEKIEAEKNEKIREERKAELAKYNTDPGVGDLALMSSDVWRHYLNSVKSEYEQRIEAEKQAEKERLAKIEADRIEQERIRKENEQLKKEAEARERQAKIEADKRAKEEKIRLEKEAKAEKERQRLAEIEADKIAKEKAESEAKIKAANDERLRIQKALEEKEEAERQAKIEAEKKKQLELKKGDSEKVKDLISDLKNIKNKYSFKSAKYQKIYSGVNELIDKTIDYINQ